MLIKLINVNYRLYNLRKELQTDLNECKKKLNEAETMIPLLKLKETKLIDTERKLTIIE